MTAAPPSTSISEAPAGGRHRRWYRDPGRLVPVLLVLLGFAVLASVEAPRGRFRTDVIAGRDEAFSFEFAVSIIAPLGRGLYTTARATVLAFTITLVLGLVLALLRRSGSRLVRWPAAFVIEFIRSTPILVQFIFFQQLVRAIDGVSLGAVQILILVLGVHYATYASEAYRAGIDSVPKGQWEAAIALNLSPLTTWTRIVIPQAVPNVLPTLGNYLVAALKDAPIAGPVLGVPGILFAATAIRGDTFRQVEPFLLAGAGFLLVSLPAAWLVRRLEARVAYERT
ncbi:MAG: ectoine/hydroxyectoine ABC transporter permease subunit EhuD [Actinobacteria bacterium]|jgi:polar amino acid transport system permease protein|nr:ectoine/hydroxyectoine ABC transporter permease subunit EhuD [Actinomycetota bacterium]